MDKKKLVVIIGPTAAKKSKLAHLIAKRFNGSLINGDAFQVYKEISAGVNKPTAEEILEFDYHLVNMISYKEEWSIAHFQREFLHAYTSIIDKKRMPILCGGSHLYTDAIINGYDLSLDTKEFEEEIKDWSNQELFDYINKYDQISAQKIGLNNYKRLLRCVTILKAQNNLAKSETDVLKNNPLFNPLIIMVNKDREQLYVDINNRFDEMFSDHKWENEVESLIKKYPDIRFSHAFKAIGYCEIADAILNNTPVDVEKLKQKTRRLAKHQLTWCNNKFVNKIVFNFDTDDIEVLFEKIKEYYYD